MADGRGWHGERLPPGLSRGMRVRRPTEHVQNTLHISAHSDAHRTGRHSRGPGSAMQGGSWRLERNVLPALPRPNRDVLWLDVSTQHTTHHTTEYAAHIAI